MALKLPLLTDPAARLQRLRDDLAFWAQAIERAEAEYAARLKLAAVAATHGDAEDRETAITAAGDSNYEIKKLCLRRDAAGLALRQLEIAETPAADDAARESSNA